MRQALIRGFLHGVIVWLFVAAYLIPQTLILANGNVWHFTTIGF